MRDGKPYWNKPNRDVGDPIYLEHWLLAEFDSKATGKWEMFCVDYKRDIHHEGGKYLEFYWEGDFQETFPFEPVSNNKEQLLQFIDYWMEMQDKEDWIEHSTRITADSKKDKS